MRAANITRRVLGQLLRPYPGVKRIAVAVEHQLQSARHSAADVFPSLIQPTPYLMMISLTAHCNLRCVGCRYGRDFMPGHQLSWEMTKELLDDAADAGYYLIRLYGGEPLIHPALPRIVEHCRHRALKPMVTTNAVLLKRRMDELFDAGLRDITVGMYGIGADYDRYVQRSGSFAKVEESIAALRDKYGDQIELQMNWLLMRPTCSVEKLHEAYAFAQKYRMVIRVDLVHYSLPYFSEGPDRCLQFTAEDRPAIERVTTELLKLQAADPVRFRHSPEGMRSIPDWLVLGPEMRVPCTASEMVWVGPDGTVQMCYVTFHLGNLHQRRFRDMVFTDGHKAAAQAAWKLNCPNCHCSSNERVMRHAPSRRRYRT